MPVDKEIKICILSEYCKISSMNPVIVCDFHLTRKSRLLWTGVKHIW